MTLFQTPSRRVRLPIALAAATLLSAAGAARADSTASVQIDSFGYTVAGGGTLQWTGVDAYQALSVQAQDQGGIAAYDANQSTDFAITPDVQAASTPHAGALASTNGDGTSGVSALTISGPGLSPYSQPNNSAASLAQSNAFTLAGSDTVTFTVGYTINVQSTGGDPSAEFGEGVIDFSAGSYLGTSGGSFDIEKYSFDSVTGIGTYDGQLTLTVTLARADDLGYYSLLTNAYASSVSAVPEPSESALLLAGLGGLGLALRKRRARG